MRVLHKWPLSLRVSECRQHVATEKGTQYFQGSYTSIELLASACWIKKNNKKTQCVCSLYVLYARAQKNKTELTVCMLLRCECAPRGCSVKSNWKLIRTVGEMDAVRLRPWPSIWFRRHITCLQQIGSAGSKWRFSASHIRTHVHKQFQVSIANNCCFPKRDSNHLHSLCKAKTIPQSMTTKYDPTCTKRFKHCFKLLHNAQLLTFSYDDNAFF